MEQNTADIRHTPEIQAIVEYLRNMKFKRKVFGGVDTESVLDHFSQVTLQYEAVISAYLAQCGEQARQIAALQSSLARAGQETAAIDNYCKQLAQWYESENARLREQLVWRQSSGQKQAAAFYAGAEQGWWGYAPQR